MKASCSLCGKLTLLDEERVPIDADPPYGSGEPLPVRHVACHQTFMANVLRQKDLLKMNHAAISFIEREDGKILAVWNRRYQGWAMPGGKVEEGETILHAQARELREETGLETTEASELYEAPSKTSLDPMRARMVHVYSVKVVDEPYEAEPGCPVEWMTREEFLEKSVFKDFYRMMFADLRDAATWQL